MNQGTLTTLHNWQLQKSSLFLSLQTMSLTTTTTIFQAFYRFTWISQVFSIFLPSISVCVLHLWRQDTDDVIKLLFNDIIKKLFSLLHDITCKLFSAVLPLLLPE